MAKQRANIPKAVRDKVLKEYNHDCAMCGKDRPEIHHLDEDPSNNDPLNLIPLCANCHTQQHNPTTALGVEWLSFFRRYNHQAILKPQFRPLLKRLGFFESVETASSDAIDHGVEVLGRVCKLHPEERSGNNPHGAEVLRSLLVTRG